MNHITWERNTTIVLTFIHSILFLLFAYNYMSTPSIINTVFTVITGMCLLHGLLKSTFKLDLFKILLKTILTFYGILVVTIFCIGFLILLL